LSLGPNLHLHYCVPHSKTKSR